MTHKLDVHLVKATARGQWGNILPGLTGIDPAILDGKGHPCPHPSCPDGPGRDRFSARNLDEGMLFCRYCNKDGTTTMDGIGAVQWLTGMKFEESLDAVAQFLGISPETNLPTRPLIEVVALGKGVRPDELLRYGAKPATRNDEGREHPVIRFPVYTEYRNGEWIPGSSFDLGIATKTLQKGKAAYNRPPGLFLPSVTKDGKQVVWTPRNGQRVYLTEGVKDAAKLLELGYPTLGLPYSELPKDLWAVFTGMDVYLVPDRDRPGLKGANRTAALLHGHCRAIRIVHLPSPVKPKNGDGVREIARRKTGILDIRAAVNTATTWSPDSVQEHAFISLPEAATKYLTRQESGEVRIIPTGIGPLDKALHGGTQQGELVVIGARPSHGKSAIALAICQAHALQEEISLFVSEEMEPELLGKRWLSSVTDRPLREYDTHELIEKIRVDHTAMERVLIAPKLQQIDAVVSAMEYATQMYGATTAIIDYAQIIDSPGKRTDYEKITDVSMKLAQVAKRTGMTTFVLCQLTRECEKRGYPTPTDLKGSGQLEQDADVILLLWYPFMLSGNAEERSTIEIHCAKNRNRGLPARRKVVLDFFPERMRFADPAIRQAEELADELAGEMQGELSFEQAARLG